MVRKSKLASRKSTSRQADRATPPLRRPSPEEQRAALEKLITEQGVRPVEDFDKFLEEVGDVWPEGENLDEFLAWLRKLRHGEPV